MGIQRIYCNRIIIFNPYNNETYETRTEESLKTQYDNIVKDSYTRSILIDAQTFDEFKNNHIKYIIATDCSNGMYDITLIYYGKESKSMLVHGSNLIMYY